MILHGFGTPEVVQTVIQACCDANTGSVSFNLQPRSLILQSFVLDAQQQVFHHHDADLCDPNQIADMFLFIRDKYSRGPDILVNNAG